MSKYGVFSGPHFPVFGLTTGEYEPGKTLYLDTFHAVKMRNTVIMFCLIVGINSNKYLGDRLFYCYYFEKKVPCAIVVAVWILSLVLDEAFLWSYILLHV